MDDIEITYEIEDGYVGGARPQHMAIDPEDFRDLPDDEIRTALEDIIHEDMLQRVNESYEESEIVEQIKTALAESPEDN